MKLDRIWRAQLYPVLRHMNDALLLLFDPQFSEYSYGFRPKRRGSTDRALDAAEVVRIYGMRWSIETFFKFTKSYLKLGTEFQGRSFDMLISHTTVVFSRYLVME
jgi:hypothetical protein